MTNREHLMPQPLETRTVEAQFEMRDDSTSGAPILEGYAATFNQEYDLGSFREQIHPDAFKRTLSNGPDVRLLVDHEGQPLARTKSGTLHLSTDSTGLHARAMLDPSDPDVQRLLPKMRRGDIDQMSFAFRVPTGGDAWSKDYTQRTIREASLAGGDVSVVTYPANESTSVSVRAKDVREARMVVADALFAELRAGTITPDNVVKLHQILLELAKADAGTDTADTALDNAQAQLAEILGVANPDPAEPADEPSATDQPAAPRSRPFDLMQRRALLLSL
jgi:HK97 family phage prohead protease